MEKLLLYYGSEQRIKKPIIYHCKRDSNSYGFGFCCTKELGVACEYAASFNNNTSYINKYSVDIHSLKILDLTDKKYSILNWVAILLENRSFNLCSEISIEAKEYITKQYHINIGEYDIVKGYTIEGSYFSFVQDFINNSVSLQQLEKAMKLRNTPVQYVIASPKALDKLKFEKSTPVNTNKYFAEFCARDLKARKNYKKICGDISEISKELYVVDIIRNSKQSKD